MKIAIAGGSGFIGKALTKKLQEKNHQVVILTRGISRKDPESGIQFIQWRKQDSHPVDDLQDTDVFINLAGESLGSGRWTEQKKERIYGSRLNAVDELLFIMKKMNKKPKALINASAIGYYGTSETAHFTELDDPGNDFLAKTVNDWEEKALQAKEIGVRTVLCRFGLILDQQEGALPRIVFPYQAFIGGTIGSGRQWMSWIHIKDVVNALLFVIENKEIAGPVNFTAPNAVQMKEFGQQLAKVLHRPHWLSVPGFALRMLLGEMSMLVLEGQKVLPQKLLENGYTFQFSNLSDALSDLFFSSRYHSNLRR